MKKYLIGSQLLKLSNCKDTDYLIILDENEDLVRLKDLVNFFNSDTKYRTASYITGYLNFRTPINESTAIRYATNYQLDKDIIGQEFPYEHHVLDWRKQYIELLNYIVDNQIGNFTKDIDFNGGHTGKVIYHVAYLTFILENNSTTLTADQKEIVQKIHDKQMPVAYLDVLQEKIRILK